MHKLSLLFLGLFLVACTRDVPPPKRAIDPNIVTRCVRSCDLNRDACMVMGRLRGQLTNQCMSEWTYCTNRCYGVMQ